MVGFSGPNPRASGRVVGVLRYPVKACRGVKVKSARVTNTGFELDRAFCVVDTKGSMVWKGEAISLLSVLYRRSSPPSMWR